MSVTIVLITIHMFQLTWEDDEEIFQQKSRVLLVLVQWILLTAGTTIVACIFTYIAMLQDKLRIQMNEYLNLINRMREGVFIISRDLKNIMFRNSTIDKIFEHKSSEESTGGPTIEDLNQTNFLPCTLYEGSNIPLTSDDVSPSVARDTKAKNGAMSLMEIIKTCTS